MFLHAVSLPLSIKPCRMDTLTSPETAPALTTGRRGGGRDAKRAARLGGHTANAPYISRRLPYVDLMDEEGLALIEENAEIILSEIGCEFRDDPEALEIWKAAGAEVTGELVRMPRGMCRQLIQDHAPREFTHHLTVEQMADAQEIDHGAEIARGALPLSS